MPTTLWLSASISAGRASACRTTSEFSNSSNGRLPAAAPWLLPAEKPMFIGKASTCAKSLTPSSSKESDWSGEPLSTTRIEPAPAVCADRAALMDSSGVQ